jgi:hypothetical protein
MNFSLGIDLAEKLHEALTDTLPGDVEFVRTAAWCVQACQQNDGRITDATLLAGVSQSPLRYMPLRTLLGSEIFVRSFANFLGGGRTERAKTRNALAELTVPI